MAFPFEGLPVQSNAFILTVLRGSECDSFPMRYVCKAEALCTLLGAQWEAVAEWQKLSGA